MDNLIIALVLFAVIIAAFYLAGKLQKAKVSDIKAVWFFARQWNEFLMLPAALVLWKCSELFLKWIDPMAAPFDSGVLQKFTYAIVGTLCVRFVSTLLMRINFPAVHRYMYSHFERDLISDSTPVKAEPNRALIEKYGPERAKELAPIQLELNDFNHNKCRRLNYALLLFALDCLLFVAILHTV